ncbi:hypothetical protein [Methanoregula sp.]|uniref:hypothetical protein n=1 Tax=Methanoregula sp. TaxID=2052170 RepID=UPI003C736D0A
MKPKFIIVLLILLCSAILIAGCTSSQSPPTPAQTQYVETAPVTNETTTGASVVPTADDFIVDDSDGQIQVRTVGSGADSQMKEVDVTLNRADGVVQTVSSNDSNQAANFNGIIQGTTSGTDHIIVKVIMDDGDTYTVIDNDIKYGEEINDGICKTTRFGTPC